jgi:hypothetical protein
MENEARDLNELVSKFNLDEKLTAQIKKSHWK